MSEFKGKKGPWSWVGGALCNESYIVGRFQSPPSSEDKALIAAAPEILDALQAVVTAMRQYEMDVGETAPYKHRMMMEKAEAALKKALGE